MFLSASVITISGFEANSKMVFFTQLGRE